ncbi:MULTISPECIES: hypothetical protein [unclassified Microcoleus]|uniref:hypothetical protein n=1 Tax=unclassified Microcoleus TaxID=2642155 RepID=UPI0025E862FF|nr:MULTISPECIES: hypothetical protein [unclassified Microcoleus]
MARNYEKSWKKDHSQRHSPIGAGRLASTGGQSKSDGDGIQDGIDSTDCTGVHRDSKGFVNEGKASFGKMLSQLRELQRSHLAYVESHEERLQLRLKAAQEHHQNVTDQMRQLEQEILCLLGETV